MLDVLKTSLLDLHLGLSAQQVRLIVGGGYGLYLKQQHLRQIGTRTLLDVDVWPEPRSTNDLDVFLAAEVVTDSARMAAIRSVLDLLGYQVVESAKFYQFYKPIPPSRLVKLDLLAGPLGAYEGRVKKDPRRVSPRPGVNLHARRVDEALHVEEDCMELVVAGWLSSRESYEGTVFIPQGFSYLLMKLLAFRDRQYDQDKDQGRHHALDVLRIVAMMTRQEYEAACDACRASAEDKHVRLASRIISEDFANETSIGALRMREHPLYRRDIDLLSILAGLRAIFLP